MNRYELVFADTGVYPPPPGITTGNFRPYDVGDIDRDNLTDLVGQNVDKPLNPDTFYNVVTTQESPNYTYYPSSLTWWYRYTFNSAYWPPIYFPPDLDSDSIREVMFVVPIPIGIAIFENIGNNQNTIVWNLPYSITGTSFAFGDFDLDGKKEFITPHPGSSGYVAVYENIDNNQYTLVFVDTVYLPNGIDVFSGQDLDGDSKPEFFVGFYSSPASTFYLYMWEATGNNIYQRTLIDQKTITVSYSTGRRSKCGDLDGDGIEEMVWATPTRLYVYKATGNNQFQQVWQWYQDHGTDETIIVNIYDLNNNGYNEIVVGGSGKTSIFEVEAVRLVRPNGGENFSSNSQQLICWQTFYPPRCDSLSLFYSTNNGQTYHLIATGIPASDTSYLWTVPNVSSDSCKVKIIAYGPGWQYDESDAVFRISATGIDERLTLSVGRFTLKAYPNPAKSVVRVCYSIPSPSPKPSPIKGEGLTKTSLKLYDISGRLIKTLFDEYKKRGNYTLIFNTKSLDTRPLRAGVYFLSFQIEDKRIIERLVIIK